MASRRTARTFNPNVAWDPQVWSYLSNSFGEEHWSRIAGQLAKPPLSLCFRISLLRTDLQAASQELATKLAGTAGTKDAPRISGLPNIPNALIVQGSGPHPVDFTAAADSDGALKEVVVDRKCGEAVLRGAPVYVPGVLGCSPHVQAGDKVVVSVAAEPMTRGTVLGSSHDKAGSEDRRCLVLGIGEVLLGRSELFRATSGLAIRMRSPVYSMPPAEGLLEGKAMLQNLPSAVAAIVLAPVPGSRILDMCAAPGGKTTAIAELVGDDAEIIALDRSHSKVGHIMELASELGIKCIKAYKMDATKAVLRAAQSKAEAAAKDEPRPSAKAIARQERREAAMRARGIEPAKKQGWPPSSFDYILLDAPCSGLGLRPRLTQTMTLPELQGVAAYQQKLIAAAVELLKPGGTLVYSTCSINPGENECNVRFALDSFDCLKLVAAEPRVGEVGLVTKDGMDGLLTAAESLLVQRFDPSAELDSIGFFIAKFQKLQDTQPTGVLAG